MYRTLHLELLSKSQAVTEVKFLSLLAQTGSKVD